ncbi:MAG: hypothetical protein ABIV48_11935 [Pyrinomonadaceae bacterium]
MKDTFLTLFFTVAILSVGLGCGIVDRVQKSVTGSDTSSSNKSLTDKAVDTTVGENKIGVPECDEVVDMLRDYADNPDDNFVVKAGKSMFVNKIRESIKASVEENKGDKVELAKNCREFKAELIKYKAEEDKKKEK